MGFNTQMIEFTKGDIFTQGTQAIVNTVNTDGVMGAGIAKLIKDKYPKVYKEYRKECRSGNFNTGQVLSYEVDYSKWIINLPTKSKWRESSKLEYITSGIDALIQEVIDLNIDSVTLPPLGCGQGGLVWSEVKSILVDKLTPYSDIRWVILEPEIYDDLSRTDTKILVCGSRGITEKYPIFKYLIDIPKEIPDLRIVGDIKVIQGEALGVDLTAKNVAHSLGYQTIDMAADWDTYGRSAGYIRNKEMVDIVDATLAVHDGTSKGTLSSITLSRNKRIPTMIEHGSIPKDLTDEQIKAYAVKRHLINTLTFSDELMGKSYLKELNDYDGTDVVGRIKELDTVELYKPVYMTNAATNYLIPILEASGYSPFVLEDIHDQLMQIKDVITPRKVNYVYVKLDTGGFSGYVREIGGKGENHYPILRVTVMVNDDALDILINPKERLTNIHKQAYKMHDESGLLKSVLNSDVSDMNDVNNLIMEHLGKHGVKSNNPVDNVHTVLVGYNTDFINLFLKAQLPKFAGMFTPRTLDLYKLGVVHELAGKYNLVPKPQLYRNDPVAYLKYLQHSLSSLM